MSEVKNASAPQEGNDGWTCCWWTDYENPEGFVCNLSIRGPNWKEVMTQAGEAMEGMKKKDCKPYRRYSHGKSGGGSETKPANGNGNNGNGANGAQADGGGVAGVVWDGDTPYCTRHEKRRAMKKSQYEGWYCSAKMPDGTYCPNKVKEAPGKFVNSF